MSQTNDGARVAREQMIQTGDYKADLQRLGGRDLTDRTVSPSRAAAFCAFRELLARTDLDGQPVAARFVVDGRSLYYSRFDKPFGQGRIHPDAPIRADVDRAEADRLATITVALPDERPRIGAVEAHSALARLFPLAMSDTGQARRVAAFLMACWNAPELGAFDPADLFALDRAVALDIATVVAFLSEQNDAVYFDRLGFREQIVAVIHHWKPETRAAS